MGVGIKYCMCSYTINDALISRRGSELLQLPGAYYYNIQPYVDIAAASSLCRQCRRHD